MRVRAKVTTFRQYTLAARDFAPHLSTSALTVRIIEFMLGAAPLPGEGPRNEAELGKMGTRKLPCHLPRGRNRNNGVGTQPMFIGLLHAPRLYRSRSGPARHPKTWHTRGRKGDPIAR
ncbi:hypothetical protein N0V93_007523 [Gnomoniopsis smithogilvyi]|uniref:Uncharacterized protein n=1 Tax=Gnomoniopsis smithogilvyi TaxID=1191159 RepID=A0A9W9CWP1_9PEZI|nr:hypothetical protein N0V93_007523 [Gnomoniopsis smithogilvyi]